MPEPDVPGADADVDGRYEAFIAEAGGYGWIVVSHSGPVIRCFGPNSGRFYEVQLAHGAVDVRARATFSGATDLFERIEFYQGGATLRYETAGRALAALRGEAPAETD
ncbi:hypothetical protein PP352_25050 [Mycobacteroides abscessus]|nr:hypothetical protein [Mycobacteroides abscessus]